MEPTARIRTRDPLLTRQPLFQLSYVGVCGSCARSFHGAGTLAVPARESKLLSEERRRGFFGFLYSFFSEAFFAEHGG